MIDPAPRIFAGIDWAQDKHDVCIRKQSDRFRDRFSLPGAKDDRLDSLVLADSLRTDGHLFRPLRPDPAAIIELRQWSRTHAEEKSRRIRRRTADDVGTALRVTPLTVAPGTSEAAVGCLQMLLPRLRMVLAQLRHVESRLAELLERLGSSAASSETVERDVAIMLSIPGMGMMTAATLLSEAPRALRDRSYHTLRALSGVAPITRRPVGAKAGHVC